MERLWAKGINLDAPVKPLGRHYSTVMGHAHEGRHIEAVEWLLDHGVDITLEDLVWSGVHKAWVALLECARRRGADILAADHDDEVGLINYAIQARCSFSATDVTDTVKWLYAHGCDPRVRPPVGYPLHAAARYGLADVVDFLLQAGADPNALDELGNSALFAVCAYGKYYGTLADRRRIIRSLVAAGANVNVRCRRSGVPETEETPLHEAVSQGACPLVLTLCGLGANVDAIAMGMTPLMDAAGCGYTRVALALLSYGANPARVVEGEDSAYYAVRNYEMLRLVIRHGADPHRRNDQGWTLLHAAARRGADRRTIRYLESLGLDPQARDKDGNTPGDLARVAEEEEEAEAASLGADAPRRVRVRHRYPYVWQKEGLACTTGGVPARGLVKRLAGYAYAGALRHMERLWLKGVNLDGPVQAVGERVLRPIDYAIAGRCIEAVEWLLSHGVRRSADDLLKCGATCAWVSLMECALRRGAHLGRVDRKGKGLIRTALEARPRSSAQCVVEAVKWLYAHGCSIGARRRYSGTLHLAAAYALPEIVDLLLRDGADPNAVIGRLEETPLGALFPWHQRWEGRAADRCAIIERLVRAGANVNQRFNGGLTVLHLACEHGALREVITLCKLGASLEAAGCGMTPLMVAAQNRHARVVRALLRYGARACRVVGSHDVAWYAVSSYEILRLVIRHGADPYRTNGEGKTLLHAAAEAGACPRTIKYLVSLGLDPRARDHHGKTPAECADDFRLGELLESL
jgi:ankyrin repeat protein